MVLWYIYFWGNAIFYYNENTGARIFHLETLKIVIYGSPGVGFYIFDVRGGTVLHFGKRQYGAAVREIVNAREVELGMKRFVNFSPDTLVT